MRSASRLFYLSIFALWAPPATCAAPQDNCPIQGGAKVDDACVSYSDLDRLNSKIKPAVDDLVETTDFFSHYRLNLYNKVCPFWDDENGTCGNIACAVDTLDNEDDVPDIWKAKSLGKLEGPLAKHPGRSAKISHSLKPLQGGLGEKVDESCVYEYDDECDERDYCVPEDESSAAPGDYVSLLQNPEKFTGYGGESAHQVWDAIYRENCFQKSSFPHSADLGVSPLDQGSAAQDLAQVFNAANTLDDQCLEKRVFYRVMSGMHASISAHLCWNFLNQTTGEWQPNPACYVNRLHEHQDRISNLYFNYALVTRAIAKLGPYMSGPSYTFCMEDAYEDAVTRAKVLSVTRRAASVPQLFDESLMFVNGEGPSLKEDFRNRFRNVSRLMDCVGCDKCRLWGKVQTSGYGTALKVLFESDNSGRPGASLQIPELKRTELVALFNTYARLGESIQAIGKFRAMVLDPEDLLFEQEPGRYDDTMREFIRMNRKGAQSTSFWDQLAYEYKRFELAIRVVLNSWLRMPKTFWDIISTECVRLFQFWVGLPMNPRKWKFALPDLNPRPEL